MGAILREATSADDIVFKIHDCLCSMNTLSLLFANRLMARSEEQTMLIENEERL